MEFSTKVGRPETVKTDAIVVGVHADGELTPTAKALDAASGGAVKAAVKSGDMTGKRGTSLLLRALAGVAAPRVLLVGLGGKDDFNEKAYTEAVRASVKAFGGAAKDVAIAACDWHVKGRKAEWQARTLTIAARETAFRSDELKSKREPDGNGVDNVTLLVSERKPEAERGVRHGTAIANGMEVTKRLGNLPPNICTPTYLGEEARKLARQWKLDVEVLETKQLEALKMGSFLAVARGSTQPPRLIVLKYNGAAAKHAPIVLVGKGITFDSGGISLKPGAAMDEMKFDMCGAASVARHDARAGRTQAEAQRGRRDRRLREHAGGQRGQAGRHRHVDVRPDDRDPEHRRRRPAHPVRRPHLRRALQARGRGRHRDAHRRLRGGAGQRQLGPVLEQ